MGFPYILLFSHFPNFSRMACFWIQWGNRPIVSSDETGFISAYLILKLLHIFDQNF